MRNKSRSKFTFLQIFIFVLSKNKFCNGKYTIYKERTFYKTVGRS